jgi:hypothetical protein
LSWYCVTTEGWFVCVSHISNYFKIDVVPKLCDCYCVGAALHPVDYKSTILRFDFDWDEDEEKWIICGWRRNNEQNEQMNNKKWFYFK